MAGNDLFNRNPIRHVETLATSKEQRSFGNTPRPSSAETHFITAMSHLHSRRYDQASEKLQKALEIAEEEAKNKKTKEKKEQLAVIRLEHGFVYWLMKKYEKAVPLYSLSIGTWAEIHGEDSKNLDGLLKDFAELLEAAGQKDQSLEVWNRILKNDPNAKK
eukprot:CAMPEP_0201487380 /NCGR_PEP_ID=MMETSP0151_2-20130828/12722_1 /ASSEMBLY_ACC=CAM_ASM_000257 /TAXON_ID=200890 /ORGANISM="Paramoeba atlantica, Strain 621/1 / CCAP 1560/9" /LENGTH=160 /DNA_ID=CAMNT_0047872393 /DNA_START=19 /DNA_END=501 /DNA_ORIENTATION=+